MIERRLSKVIIFILVLLIESPVGVAQGLKAPACGIVSDGLNHIPNDSVWSGFTPPAVGGTYQDRIGGQLACPVTRLTNNVAKGVQNGQTLPQYSLTGTFSANDQYLLLYNGESFSGRWLIMDIHGKTVVSVANMSAALRYNNSQWRWDPTSDTVIWNTSGNVLYKCTTNPAAGTMSCASSYFFSEYTHTVVFPGDSDVNANGWVPMVGQNVNGGTADMFMFNLITGTKSAVAGTTICTGDANGTQPLSGCIHRLLATPNNGFTSEFGGSVGIEAGGQYLWEPGFGTGESSFKQIQSNANHHAPGYDLSGNEVAAYEASGGFFNNNGNTPIPRCANTYNPMTVLLSITMKTNRAQSCLLDVANEANWHVSWINYNSSVNGKWIVYSQQAKNNAERWNNDGSYQKPSVAGWTIYDNEVILIRVDAGGHINTSKVYRLTYSHSREKEDYWGEPHAVISRSGKYIAFGSNAAWGATGCGADGNATDCGDVYVIGPLS